MLNVWYIGDETSLIPYESGQLDFVPPIAMFVLWFRGDTVDTMDYDGVGTIPTEPSHVHIYILYIGITYIICMPFTANWLKKN